MRNKLLAGAAVAALTAGWGASPAVADGLTIDLEALYLHRDTVDDIDIVALDTGNFQLPVLSTNDLGMGYRPGGRLTVGIEPDENRRYEVSGFWLDEHSDSEIFSDPDLVKGNNLDVFFGKQKSFGLNETELLSFQTGKIVYESDLWNVEGNFIYDFPAVAAFTPSVLMGARYVELGERFSLLTGTAPLDQDDIGYIQTDTSNRMGGLQLGGLGSWALSNAVSLDFLAKVGVYANIAEQKTYYFSGNSPNSPSNASSARGAKGEIGVASVGELGASMSVDLTDNLAFSLGYTLMHFGGVALAPHQFPVANTQFALDALDDDGSALYHGATARATLRLGGGNARQNAAVERRVAPAAHAQAGPSQLTLDFEALYMNREVVDGIDVVAVRLGAPTSDVVALSTDGLAMGYRLGGRGTIGFEPNENRRFEVSGFWLDEHSDSRSAEDPQGNLVALFANTFGDLNEDNFEFVDTAKLAYESDIWNVEGNYVYRFEAGSSFSPALLVGARYIDLDERFSLLMGEDPFDQDDLGYVQTDTDNRLIGGQLGATADWALWPHIILSGVAKIGAFANTASQKTHYFGGLDDGAGSREIARGADGDLGIATVGELGATLRLDLSESISFSFGYTVMHVGGVALAPRNFPQINSFASLDRLDMNGRALYHGGTAKLTWRL